MAGGAVLEPGRTADAAERPLLRRAGPRAQRRARLDHHAGRGRAGGVAVPPGAPGRRGQQPPRDRGRRHRPLRLAARACLRGRPAAHCSTAQCSPAPTPVPPLRALGVFPTRAVSAAATPAAGNESLASGGRAAATLTVADLLDRWWNNYDGNGVGLYGGSLVLESGDNVTTFKLHGARRRLQHALPATPPERASALDERPC